MTAYRPIFKHPCPNCGKMTWGVGDPYKPHTQLCCECYKHDINQRYKAIKPPAPPIPPRPTTTRCAQCGQPTTNAFVCDVCIPKMRQAWNQRMQQMFNSFFVPPEPIYDTWYHCADCGDLTFAAIKPFRSRDWASQYDSDFPSLWYCPSCLSRPSHLKTLRFEVKTMTPVTNVRVWWDPTILAYRVASPYNKDLVETLKKHIPYSDRSFDEVTKTWIIVERQLTPLQGLFTLLGIKPSLLTRQQVEAAAQQSQSAGAQRGQPLDAIALQFVKLVPMQAMQKAYRLAALELHPDRNQGDGSRMASLNAAWERLQKEVYGQ